MQGKMWKSVVIFAVLFGYETLASNIKVSVYYETLCSDSVRFLVNQFDPVYQNNSDYIEIDLVPYGKASADNSSGSWVFDCQHGEAECYGNKVHSCAIELYPVSQSTDFVVCAMSSGNASLDDNLEQCAISNNIAWTSLQECMSSGQGDELLAANGRRTDKLIPDLINFVPTIVFNDVFSTHLHSLSITNFDDTFQFILEQVQCGFCHFSGSNIALSTGKFVFGLPLLVLLFQKLFV